MYTCTTSKYYHRYLQSKASYRKCGNVYNKQRGGMTVTCVCAEKSRERERGIRKGHLLVCTHVHVVIK